MLGRVNRRDVIRWSIAAAAAGMGAAGMPAKEIEAMSAASHRADWMSRGSFGMMVHWLAPGPPPEKGDYISDLNRAVDAFDRDRFLKQFRESGADWLIFTIGQNTGYYASPSATLDRLVGP